MTGWHDADRGPQKVEVPSGNTCLARRRPLAGLWKAGKINNSLIPLVERQFRPDREDEPGIEWSTEMVRDMLILIDRVVVECVAEPRVYPVPICLACKGSGNNPEEPVMLCEVCLGTGEATRDPERLYVDEVDIIDKQFLYQWAVGQVKDLESFRAASEGDVESIPDGEDVSSEDAVAVSGD